MFGVDSLGQTRKRLDEAFPFLAVTALPSEVVRVATDGKGLPPHDLQLRIGTRSLTLRVSLEVVAPRRVGVFFAESSNSQVSQLTEDAARFRALFESAGDAILLLRDGRIVECNFKTAELFVASQSYLQGKSLAQLSPEIQPDGSSSTLRMKDFENRALSGERLSFNWTHRRPDASTVAVETSLSQVWINGQPCLISVVRDSTARNRRDEQLRQAQKMEAVARLAGRMAHDFNNYLTVINGYSAWMKQYILPEDPLFSQVSEIQRAGQNASDLTKRLLAFSRHDAAELHPLDLNHVVTSALDAIRSLAGQRIKVHLNLRRPIGLILGDEISLREMLLGLASNACEAMPAGGVLTIETSERTHPGDDLMRAGLYAQLSVSDTGFGMDETVRTRAFDPYYTTKEAGRSGLGLSIAHGIVKRCGGHIDLATESGKGATFHVFFPAQIGQPQPATEERHAPVDALFGTETVLVVDDNEQVRRLTTMTLQQYGYQVLETSDPREALEIGQTHLGKISLLVTDLVMPGLSGIELARLLRATRPQLGVLLMTGYSGPKTDIDELEPPCALVEKPYQPDILAAKVREVLHSGHRPAKVLVVDDDLAVREFLAFLLEQEGYDVEQAGDGRAAIALVKASPVDLLITDLVMPEIEGLETIQTLRKLQPELLIIAISGYQDGRFLSIASKLGSSATLAKPVAPSEFLETVRNVLRPAAKRQQSAG